MSATPAIAAMNLSEIGFLIAMAIVGIIQWWAERRKKQQLEEEERRTIADSTRRFEPLKPTNYPSPPVVSPEEERVRRFLEALGVPPSESSRPAPPPQPVAPLPSPPPPPRTIQRPSVSPARRQPVEPIFEGDEMAEARGMGGPALEVERSREEILNPPPIFQEFPAAKPEPIYPASPHPIPQPLIQIGAADGETTRFGGAAIPLTLDRKPTATASGLVAAITNPDSLRTAFLLREVLGPPPGLGYSALPHA